MYIRIYTYIHKYIYIYIYIYVCVSVCVPCTAANRGAVTPGRVDTAPKPLWGGYRKCAGSGCTRPATVAGGATVRVRDSRKYLAVNSECQVVVPSAQACEVHTHESLKVRQLIRPALYPECSL